MMKKREDELQDEDLDNMKPETESEENTYDPDKEIKALNDKKWNAPNDLDQDEIDLEKLDHL